MTVLFWVAWRCLSLVIALGVRRGEACTWPASSSEPKTVASKLPWKNIITAKFVSGKVYMRVLFTYWTLLFTNTIIIIAIIIFIRSFKIMMDKLVSGKVRTCILFTHYYYLFIIAVAIIVIIIIYLLYLFFCHSFKIIIWPSLCLVHRLFITVTYLFMIITLIIIIIGLVYLWVYLSLGFSSRSNKRWMDGDLTRSWFSRSPSEAQGNLCSLI